MAKQRYFPSREGQRIQWLKNYEMKFPVHAAVLGMAGEVGQTLFDLAYAIFLLGTWHPGVQQDAEEATEYKKYMLDAPAVGEPLTPLPTPTVFAPPGLVLPGIFARLPRMRSGQIARIKVAPGYTPEIGKDLDIIGPEEKQKDAAAFPKVTATVHDGSPNQEVELKFIKDGHEGVSIESRVNGGPWEHLAVDSASPYIDNRPLQTPGQAETREYRVRYWDKGQPNGNFTPVIKVTVGA